MQRTGRQQTGLLAIDSSSTGKIDLALTLLCAMAPGVTLQPVQTTTSPRALMTAWLDMDVQPTQFDIDNAATLKATDETKAVVRYQNLDVVTEEVEQRLKQGMVPSSLALSWAGRVSFTLTDGGRVQGIKLLDVEPTGDHADSFAADVALATGMLRPLVADLLAALGGEVQA